MFNWFYVLVGVVLQSVTLQNVILGSSEEINPEDGGKFPESLGGGSVCTTDHCYELGKCKSPRVTNTGRIKLNISCFCFTLDWQPYQRRRP